jgi:hypothetical protein
VVNNGCARAWRNEKVFGRSPRRTQHADQYRPGSPVLLAVDQQLAEGGRLAALLPSLDIDSVTNRQLLGRS